MPSKGLASRFFDKVLEVGGAGGAVERDDVADVFHAREVHDEAFEAETEASVGGGAVFAKVEVPPIGFFREAEFVDPGFEDIEAVFALGAADELADAGDEDIHGADGFVVVVAVHVEGFDIFGVVGDDCGATDFLFGEPAFVFGL